MSGKTCDHCKRAIVDSSAATSCASCAFFLCSRCSQQPNFSTAELRAQHPAPVGCGRDCRRSHGRDGPCLVCGQGICICHASVCAQFTSTSRFAAAWGGAYHTDHFCLIGDAPLPRGSWVSAAPTFPVMPSTGGAVGCGRDCRRDHHRDGPCLVCGQGICICHASVCARFTSTSRFAAAWGGADHIDHFCFIGDAPFPRGSWVSAARPLTFPGHADVHELILPDDYFEEALPDDLFEGAGE